MNKGKYQGRKIILALLKRNMFEIVLAMTTAMLLYIPYQSHGIIGSFAAIGVATVCVKLIEWGAQLWIWLQ